MIRMQVSLDQAEAEALLELSNSELRDPRDQIRVLVRQGLIRLGKLPDAAVAVMPQEVSDACSK